MIAKTQAVVLRTAPFSETSRMVTWFTADYGKITTSIRGSQRPKSMFLGQYDLFYTCELLFYERERDNVHAIRECSPLNPRLILRDDWKACAIASYLADLFLRISPARAYQPGLFALLELGLDHAPLAALHPGVLFWYELKLLRAVGLAPRFQPPRQATSDGTWLLDLSRGGAIQSDESSATEARHLCRLPDAALRRLIAWQEAETVDSAMQQALTPAEVRPLEQVMGQFLEYHLETPLRSRELALDLLHAEGS